MAAADWRERIPAAIARAEEYVGERTVRWIPEANDYVTAGEVAVVKALWRVTMAEGWHIDPALREFVAKIEKIERLGHG